MARRWSFKLRLLLCVTLWALVFSEAWYLPILPEGVTRLDAFEFNMVLAVPMSMLIGIRLLGDKR